MGLLDHLWDDTVAGPPPDTGLGKLRKLRSFASSAFNTGSNCKESSNGGSDESAARISRCITIVKPPGYHYPPTSTPPSTSGSTTPVSPFSGPGCSSLSRFRRRSTSDAYDRTREIIHRSPFDM